MYVLKVLVQNVVLLESKDEELNRKKDLVFIIEDLALLNKLWLEKNTQECRKTTQQYKLSKYLERNTPERIDTVYWKQIKEQLIELIS